jgi:hypothetical protein
MLDILLYFFLTFFILVYFLNKLKKDNVKNIMYSQSDLHRIIKHYLNKSEYKKDKKTQMNSRKDEQTKIIIIDEEAYWVVDNIFYRASVINGLPDIPNAVPVDIYNMPKKELDKMLFILDNLSRGNDNDSSSSGQ